MARRHLSDDLEKCEYCDSYFCQSKEDCDNRIAKKVAKMNSNECDKHNIREAFKMKHTAKVKRYIKQTIKGLDK